jgi:hypothetical protein
MATRHKTLVAEEVDEVVVVLVLLASHLVNGDAVTPCHREEMALVEGVGADEGGRALSEHD